MTVMSADYMRIYMRQYRANGGPVRARIRRGLRRRHRLPLTFKPLQEQRHGHCCFCGLRSLATVCGFCRRELEGRAA